jgi:HAD superfamily hydrolase (TIGR01549 family)
VSATPNPSRDVEVVVFDLDGTLLDSDAALLAAFEANGVAIEDVTYGHAVAAEAERLGLTLDAYESAYDTDAATPFPGIDELLAVLPRWAVCSNKHPRSAVAEFERLGWRPEVACFADSFDWEHKRLGPVLDLLGVSADRVLMVGDTTGDLVVAEEVGCAYAWAGWNPRTAAERPDGVVLARPADLLGLLGGGLVDR